MDDLRLSLFGCFNLNDERKFVKFEEKINWALDAGSQATSGPVDPGLEIPDLVCTFCAQNDQKSTTAPTTVRIEQQM